MKIDRKTVLEVVAEIGDRVAERHGDTCPVGVAAREFSASARRELAAGDGPAQVATEAYRKHWEGIFGKRPEVGQA